MTFRWMAALVLTGLAMTAQAEETDLIDDTEQPWVEVKAALPPFPDKPDWVRFTVTSGTTNQFFIDVGSLHVTSDGVVRYTLKVLSENGAVNITREGMRCASHEQKLYAIGDDRTRTWREPRNPSWQFFRKWAINRQLNVLYDDFFCPDRIAVRKVSDAVEALRRDRPIESLLSGSHKSD
ncbi:CNP1-like family protein [Leeia aquatica]|uniref:CNP1-like uncharacterized domain-containing protein n=1 Tax=Leeia aquatica TaxID=2725557 RepID=A0A847S7P4_9NEIS|nr:CNP1-like family protein [Leeia aquatica]NLR74875.1 hypothetical protein [Leeia aquatica]